MDPQVRAWLVFLAFVVPIAGFRIAHYCWQKERWDKRNREAMAKKDSE